MYSEILQIIFDLYNINSEKQKILYLNTLQNAGKYLLEKYQTNNVSIDYSSPEIQAVYMLRYYPLYSQLIYKTLSELLEKEKLINFNDNQITCSIFGGGPCPEAYGLVNFIREYYKKIDTIVFYSFDKYSSDWKTGRNITLRSLIPGILKCKSIFNSCSFNITYPIKYYKNNLEVFNSIFAKSNIIIFQNFLNEVNLFKNRNKVLENLVHIYNNLSKNSIMIFIELDGYYEVSELLVDFQKLIQKNKSDCILVPICSSDPIFDDSGVLPTIIKKEFASSELSNNISDILKTNFFSGELNLKKNIYYNTLVIKK